MQRSDGRTSGGVTRRIVRGPPTGSIMPKLSPAAATASTSAMKNAQLWGAVALQQHMLKSIQNFGGATAAAQPRPGKLTLAEKMGLVEAPPPPPTEAQWETVVTKSLHRNDCSRSCSICQVNFVASSDVGQVILSCSHVFHETCMKQFEKFVRRSGATPSCPICRTSRYHKRVHYEGKAQVEHHAATKIQALVRGVIQRKKYLTMRLRSNPTFRINYALTQFRAISDMYTVQAVAREKQVDKFLEELDLTRQKAVADLFTKKDWESVRNKILSRHDGLECPICMCSIDVAPADDEQMPNTRKVSQKTPALDVPAAFMLSCAHCFHGPCLSSFENFSHPNGTPDTKSLSSIPRCPVCRSGYAKRSLID